METPESRRAAGDLIHTARRKAKISQRELARVVDISETWLRAMTAGLRGEEPQRARDEVWSRLAEAVGADKERVFSTLGREAPTPDEDEEDHPPEPSGRFAQETITWHGRLVEVVRDLEADTEGIPDEESKKMIERALAQAEAQAKLYLDMERRRWEREQSKGDADDKT
ncbi:helix-turn-helix domain-containing protein [Nocardiopsis oceani]